MGRLQDAAEDDDDDDDVVMVAEAAEEEDLGGTGTGHLKACARAWWYYIVINWLLYIMIHDNKMYFTSI